MSAGGRVGSSGLERERAVDGRERDDLLGLEDAALDVAQGLAGLDDGLNAEAADQVDEGADGLDCAGRRCQISLWAGQIGRARRCDSPSVKRRPMHARGPADCEREREREGVRRQQPARRQSS